MKKTIFSTILFILFLLFIAISYLSFFGYETDRFNQIIKSEIKKSNKDITLDFEKISILLDIKKLTLFTKFINTNLNYSSISIPLRSLRADVELNSLIKKKPGIKKIILVTEYLDLDSKKIKPLIKKLNLQEKNFKNIKNVRFNSTFQLEFDEDLKIKDNFKVKGTINYANIKILDEYQARDLYTEFFYEKDNLELKNLSWRFNNVARKDIKWGIHGDHGIYGDLKIKLAKKKYDIDATFRTKIPIALNFIKTPGINYSFSEKNTSQIKTKFSINKNKTTFFKIFRLEDKDNEFQIKGLHLDKNYNLINFKEIKVKTSVDNNINNDFKIINKKKKIDIQGKIFDAKILIKNLTKDGKKNNFLKKISKDIEIDFNRILKDEKFPIKNFRLVGKINKGAFEKISAKSDFLNNKHLDISLQKQEKTDTKILEVHSDIAMPLLSDYKFFQGLEGGNLIYVSTFNKKNSSNFLTINNFKLNKAPALAKLLTLADLKGLTDTLRGEGISFETLAINYETSPLKIDVKEIFMIGPSISILIEGYVEKKSGLVSLRGTLVPAKFLNSVISKIPKIGDILVGKKIGEGVFGLSFKIKGLPDNLKTTVNPVKTLTPRFITRALEAAKKNNTK